MATSTIEKISPSLLTIPIEFVYRILDNLDTVTILLSVRNVCLRLNAITDTYHPYQVHFFFYLKTKREWDSSEKHSNISLFYKYSQEKKTYDLI
jgi:hypothetical protein